MGYLTDQSQHEYYSSNLPTTDLGGYQFLSLSDIIDNFMATFVGEGKILSTVLRGDVSFHAHRALAELNYDTFKSCKSQEIEVCPNLKMPLPQDYVNYVKIVYSDANGIENVLYPASKTSNPFSIEQTQGNCEDCGDTSSSYQYDGQDLRSQETVCGASTVTCTFSTANMEDASHDNIQTVYDYTDTGAGAGWSPADKTDYLHKLFGNVNDYCLCLQSA